MMRGATRFRTWPAATYEVKVTAAGFRPFTRTNVIATINNVTRVDVQIEVGAGNQEITVVGSAAVLQTDTSDVHTNLNPTETSNLPLPYYRNYQSLINLVPGATPTTFQNSVTDTPQRSLTTNVNGTNRNNNNTRVDGAGDVFVWLPHHTVYVPPEETIETVNISTDSFDAEQGMAGGAAITVTTKSGTNRFHGVGFAFWDDNKLQARNFFLLRRGHPVQSAQHRWGHAGRSYRERQAILLRELGGQLGAQYLFGVEHRTHGGAASRRF
jgi:hypothetical protein